jgi:SAM-dependent methyltransferase
VRAYEPLTWSADVVDPAPGDRILEVGCGRGHLTSLLAERLTTGFLIAIDRSPAMIEAAARRNRAAVEVGRVRLRTASLTDCDFGSRVFDVVVSFDVQAFWTAPAPEWDVVRQVLAPEGRVIIAYPMVERAIDAAVETTVRELAGARGLCLRTVHRARTTPVECKALEFRLQ